MRVEKEKKQSDFITIRNICSSKKYDCGGQRDNSSTVTRACYSLPESRDLFPETTTGSSQPLVTPALRNLTLSSILKDTHTTHMAYVHIHIKIAEINL